MPNPLVSYDYAIPHLQHWAYRFMAKYPNRFEFWELINAVWVDPKFHEDSIKYPYQINRSVYYRMSHYIKSQIKPWRTVKELTNQDIF
jgi:hypothetical protein